MTDVAAAFNAGGGGQPQPQPQPGAGAQPGQPGAQPQAAWYDKHPDQPVRELMAQKGYDTPEKVASAYWNANKFIGGAKDVVAIPAADAKPEVWNDFYTRMGRPAKAEDYKFEYPKGADGKTAVDVNPAFESFGKSLFHEFGLPPAMAQKGIDRWNAFAADQIAKQSAADKEANDQAMAKLKTDYGGKYEPALAKGQDFVRKLGLRAELLNSLEANMGAAPLTELLLVLADKALAGPDQIIHGDGGGGSGDPARMTPEAAKVEYDRLMADKDFTAAYWDKNHTQHTVNVNRIVALQLAMSRPRAA